MAHRGSTLFASRLWNGDKSPMNSQSDAILWNSGAPLWGPAGPSWAPGGVPAGWRAAPMARSGWIASALANAGSTPFAPPAANAASILRGPAPAGGVSARSTVAAGLSSGPSATNAASGASGGSLGYASVLSTLQNAAAGGMTASKFSALQAFAAGLNQPGGTSVSAYVQQIADDVILGNSANAGWNGGSSTATTLGNLGATSTQTQADELIGMWFQGANLPSLDVSSVGAPNYNSTYQASTLPLYGASGAPRYTDVNQGVLGDCYLLSALGEVALQDPAAIENMIVDNGNGTYGVRFFVNGAPDDVTVNTQLPVMGGGHRWADGSTLEFANGSTDDWVALVEKAYAQLNAQTDAPHGMTLNSASDSYAGIASGNGSALTEITGQPESSTGLRSGQSQSTLQSILSNTASSFQSGQEVLMSTPGSSSGNLVGNHMFMVTAINAASGAFTIHNPWAAAYSGSLAMTFNETIQQLASDNCTLWVTSGHTVA